VVGHAAPTAPYTKRRLLLVMRVAFAHAKQHATSGICPSCFSELNQELPS